MFWRVAIAKALSSLPLVAPAVIVVVRGGRPEMATEA